MNAAMFRRRATPRQPPTRRPRITGTPSITGPAHVLRIRAPGLLWSARDLLRAGAALLRARELLRPPPVFLLRSAVRLLRRSPGILCVVRLSGRPALRLLPLPALSIRTIGPRPPSARGGRPSRDARSALNERILDVATELFLAQGYGLTTIEALARRAGISKRTFYHRFADKSVLFGAVVHRIVEAHASSAGRAAARRRHAARGAEAAGRPHSCRRHCHRRPSPCIA